jgi:salicylate hydroxylase
VIVAERRTDTVEAGAGIQLSPNASHILIGWGLGPALGRTAVAPVQLTIRRWGEPRSYASMPMGLPTGHNRDSAPFWVALRQDLHGALRGAAQGTPGVRVLEGTTVEGLKMNRDSVEVQLAAGDSRKAITASAIVGADGQRSRVRQLLGDARDLDRPGWEAWRTLIPAETQLDFIRAPETALWLGRDSHAVHYPVDNGRLINLVVIKRSPTKEDGWAREGDPAQLKDIVATAAPTLKTLIGSAPSWAVWTLFDRSPSPYIAKGLAALAGDAAHPFLPFLAQGAAMAVEDAAVLATTLPSAVEATPETIRKGLANYAVQRGHRVHKVFKTARQNATVYHLPKLGAWFRDRRMDKLGPDGMRARFDWLYDWRA